jgi:hypothetical protein
MTNLLTLAHESLHKGLISLMPANLFIILAVRGVRPTWRSARLGLMVATLGTILLYLVSTPAVVDGLLWSLRHSPPPYPARSPTCHGAIIVRSGDYRRGKDTRMPIRSGVDTRVCRQLL